MKKISYIKNGNYSEFTEPITILNGESILVTEEGMFHLTRAESFLRSIGDSQVKTLDCKNLWRKLYKREGDKYFAIVEAPGLSDNWQECLDPLKDIEQTMELIESVT